MVTRQAHKRFGRSKEVDLPAIGRRIRQIRGNELTQTQFARMLGLGQTQLSRYELGQSAPTLRVLLLLRSYSGRSVDWVLVGDNSYGRR